MGEIITNKICIEIEDEPCNPIFVVWKNSIGGWSYWCFEYNQLETTNVSKGDIFERSVFDLETAEGTYQSISNNPERRILVEASGVTRNQFDAISEINSSPKIYQMFKLFDTLGNPINRNPDGSPKRIELLSISTTTARQTKHALNSIQFQFEYPRVFTQTQQ